MCSCDWNHVCSGHRGTRHDPWSDFEDDPRERDLDLANGTRGADSAEGDVA